MNVKRFLLACLGMVLLGTAGLLILHEFVQSPPPARSQSAGAPVSVPGGPVPPGGARPVPAPGQYKDIVPPLLDALADSDASVRQLAAATLVTIGPDAVPPLVQALKGKDRETRANAAYVLGQLGESAQEALPALAGALKDEDREVRRRAAFALHNIVTRSEAAQAAAQVAAAPGAGDGEGAVPPPRMMMRPAVGGSSYAPAGGGPLDPGLLVPSAKPEKEPKKD
jgi:hypothetical protein